MNLWDARLGFARHLIRHWSGIALRANELVPDERYLDPVTLLKVHGRMIIADISDPQVAAIQVLGSAIRSRYPEGTQRGDDWLSFIPSAYLELAYTALDKLIGTPCGVYYHFQLLDRGPRLAPYWFFLSCLTNRKTSPPCSSACRKQMTMRSLTCR
jgi:hypothetical protein